ncbi:DUF2309 domain-containing protein [Halobellus rufus]|uniref:DUF2309 domain-containing protein n=1 Tax=Halobellus rufus TaxID=1448860 RepID=UPI000679C97F|nr:DUF2309 domain-containing protein [Halobellus rufus]
MSTETAIRDSIEQAKRTVGRTWPLHSFVTANPLSGFEDRPFHEAVREGERLYGGQGYPSASVFRRAWEQGRIDPGRLRESLAQHGYGDPEEGEVDPEALLDRMASETEAGDATPDGDDQGTTPSDRVDAVLTKWLSAFLDEGAAEWPMPDRSRGFYRAFRAAAQYDREIPDQSSIAALPDDPIDALAERLADHPRDRWPSAFEHHLSALPGWTGLIKRRVDDGDVWQSACPITLPGYLAVRLTLADQFDAPIVPDAAADIGATSESGDDADDAPLAEAWLNAWEATYRERLVDEVAARSPRVGAEDERAEADGGAEARPDAQLVFCIDTRSEVLRRHVESAGNYETHGYAGFFGIPMRYEGFDSEVGTDACPPIVDVAHRIEDRPSGAHQHSHERHTRWTNLLEAGENVLEGLKSNAATAFSFVEAAGSGYGAALAARTLLPGRVHDALDAIDDRTPCAHEFCRPALDRDGSDGDEIPRGMTFEERVEYAANAFELMGWEEFARLVVFTGHASQTANNPFGSSLDCGACAGNPGGPNARVLAAICNEDRVQAALAERGIEIPDDTVFVAGEHNTTTDEVTLYAGDVPESHERDVEALRADLASATADAAAERATSMGAAPDDAERETKRRAADWAETRPEWGLAGNAGFVVGPRELTADLDLGGRSFLHSYDWRTDPEGDALEAILTGPMVVTQWINTQYYFATVDTAAYGSGSKVTQNPVGNVGVYQGNGGDLLGGLPLQSVMRADDEPYHQPLRLSTVVHAPVDRVTDVLSRHEHLTDLLDNDWLSLTVVDPTREHAAFQYEEELAWTGLGEAAEPTVEEAQKESVEVSAAVADD